MVMCLVLCDSGRMLLFFSSISDVCVVLRVSVLWVGVWFIEVGMCV